MIRSSVNLNFQSTLVIKSLIQGQLGLENASLDLFDHLHAENLQCVSNILHFFCHYFFQQRSQLIQGVVSWVIYPSADENSVVRLKLEVFSDIIHD
jgi:hypothetical protein